MKRLFFLAVLAVCALHTSHAQDSLAQSRPTARPNLWVTGTGGASENGLQGSLELSVGVPRVGGMLAAQYLEASQFLSDAPLKKHRMFSVLYGRALTDGPLIARLSAGVGYMDGVQHVGWSREKLVDGWLGDYCDCAEASFQHLNVPLRVDFLIAPFGHGGAGTFLQANLNPTRSFVSFGFQVALGKLR